MPSYAAKREEAIREALTLHSRTSKNLSIHAYAKAAGISRDWARKLIGKMGLPYVNPWNPPGETGATGAGSDPGDPPAVAAEDPPVAPAAPPTVPTPAAPAPAVAPTVPRPAPGPTPAGGDASLRLHVDRTLATITELPAAVGAEVRRALMEVAAVRNENPVELAQAAARQRVAEQFVSDTTAMAGTIATEAADAGRVLHREWSTRGLKSEFPTPGEMVKVLLDFWFRWRDEIVALQDAVAAYDAQLAYAAHLLDMDTRRREEHERVWTIVLTAAMNGRPLPAETIQEYLRLADTAALGGPTILTAPPSSIIPVGER